MRGSGDKQQVVAEHMSSVGGIASNSRILDFGDDGEGEEGEDEEEEDGEEG